MIDIDKICKYANTFHKEAAPPVAAAAVYAMYALSAYGIAAMTSGFATSIANSTVDIENVKAKVQEIISLIDAQEADGFGDFADTFTSYREDARTVVQLIDEMLKAPGHDADTNQIQKAEQFVKAARNLVYNSHNVTAALDQMQTASSTLGNIMHSLQLNFGFNMTRWHAFTNTISKITGSLSLLADKVEKSLQEQLVQAQKVDAQAKAQQPVQPTGAGSSAVDQLAAIKI